MVAFISLPPFDLSRGLPERIGRASVRKPSLGAICAYFIAMSLRPRNDRQAGNYPARCIGDPKFQGRQQAGRKTALLCDVQAAVALSGVCRRMMCLIDPLALCRWQAFYEDCKWRLRSCR